MEAKQIMITDRGQSARMTLDLRKDDFAFSFNGTIEQETLSRIFQTPPLEGSLIQGDIEVSVFKAPLRFNARGRLRGENYGCRCGMRSPSSNFFSWKLNQTASMFDPRTCSGGRARLSLMGKLLPEANALRLDMDISADRVVWRKSTSWLNVAARVETMKVTWESAAAPGRHRPPQGGSFHPCWIHLEPISSHGFSVPERGKRTDRTRGRLWYRCSRQRRRCIRRNRSQCLALCDRRSVRIDQRCLSDNKQAVRGNFSLTGRLTGRGTQKSRADPPRRLRIQRSRSRNSTQSPTTDSPLEAAFNYLNETGDFSVAFPDLDRESFPFRAIRAGER